MEGNLSSGGRRDGEIHADSLGQVKEVVIYGCRWLRLVAYSTT